VPKEVQKDALGIVPASRSTNGTDSLPTIRITIVEAFLWIGFCSRPVVYVVARPKSNQAIKCSKTINFTSVHFNTDGSPNFELYFGLCK